MGNLFQIVLLRPVLNILLLLYSVLGHNYALAIVVLTVVLRLITQPLMAPQLKTSKKMNEIQPLLKELEKKYKGDKERLAQEQMKLYREHGVNPMSGCLPMLAQIPIWIAFYQVIMQTVGSSPAQLLELGKHIYNFGIFAGLRLLIPLSSHFLWLDLGRPDPFYILPILTAATMWLQQKMMTPPVSENTEGAQQQLSQSMSQSMMFMPLIFGLFTMNLASGLGLYFIISNVVGMVVQYFTTGPGGLKLGSLGGLLPKRQAPATVVPTAASEQKGTKSGSRKKKH